ncbi:putative Sir2 family [Trypanosoma vivax]|uniref:NAD-dependent protein deacylase n=1 Tax=Trypanosoma vivax (strain Y486) TaxID=1055687 RepID=G0U0Q0_TRYVY|nr:putative transcriptional regulator/Sir2 family protein [Trypanosoma vivax]KAH8608996.1 putative Sir2 family [Trypanosoma vivax]CCC49649.1 putative transcriptional regulator/Sir2 family protein [Trypanosoma vivax Y486]
MAERLAAFIQRCGARRCVVLTGAGCSTESGIPDYRGPNGLYRRANFVPLTLQAFIKKEREQKRYWARSMLGYDAMSGASCNAAHLGLFDLCRAGVVEHLLTQNVDGLHHLAAHGGVGTKSVGGYSAYTSSNYGVQELHGNIHQVCCMKCGDITSRQQLQIRLCEANRQLYEEYSTKFDNMRPDGDYEAPITAVEAMQLVQCERCGGALKPHVVLFGENLPPKRVETATAAVRGASCLLCVGTSLQVFSAYRHVLTARECCVPVAIVTAGVTRADGLESMRVETNSVAATIEALTCLLLGRHQHAGSLRQGATCEIDPP